jgi:predicted Zn-dependent protease
VARWPLEMLKVNHDWTDGLGGGIEHKEKFGAIIDCPEKKTFLIIQKSLKRRDQATYIFSTNYKTLAGLASLTAAFVLVGLPLLGKLIEATTIFIPQSVERKIGDRALESMAAQFKPCKDAEAERLLNKIIDDLLSHQDDRDMKVTVHLYKTTTSNAFALPGNNMAVLTGFLEDAETEQEISGVLAHEIGHIAHRDAIKYMMQQLGLSALFSLSAGDTSSITKFTATLSGLSYSREKELEADAFSKDIMSKGGYGTQGLIDFLGRVDETDSEVLRQLQTNLSFLSTHPETAERLEHLKLDQQPEKPKSILTKKEFEYLKNACAVPGAKKQMVPEAKKPSPRENADKREGFEI